MLVPPVFDLAAFLLAALPALGLGLLAWALLDPETVRRRRARRRIGAARRAQRAASRRTRTGSWCVLAAGLALIGSARAPASPADICPPPASLVATVECLPCTPERCRLR